MPYALVGLSDGSYAVKNKATGKIMSKHTTKQKAVYNAYAAAFYRLYIGKETMFCPS